MARSVNFVWNFVNELSQRSIKERGVFLSAYDMHPYTKGAGKELGLHSQTLQCIAGEYVTRRKQFKKVRLNWRKSGGVSRSLGCNPPSKPQRLFVENSINMNSRSFLCVNQNSLRARLWQFSNKMRLEFQSLSYAVSMVLAQLRSTSGVQNTAAWTLRS